jgi:hypothetical protein
VYVAKDLPFLNTSMVCAWLLRAQRVAMSERNIFFIVFVLLGKKCCVNEHYVMLMYAMKLLMCDKGAFNIGYWSRRRPSRQTSFLLN